jgi:RimJ/RimL family protein N-acetyltransferase
MGTVGLEEEIGYWLGVDFWGQGYGKEAMRAMAHFAFFTLHQEELRGCAIEDNIPSRRIMEGLGFNQTGLKDMSSLGLYWKEAWYNLYSLSQRLCGIILGLEVLVLQSKT